MKRSTYNLIISLTSALLVTFLAGTAFVLSYDVLRDLALDNGVKPSLVWLWPLSLDAMMIAASLAVLRTSLNPDERSLYPWVLVGGFTVASIAFNVLHAKPVLLSRAVFALPPAVVFLAFELLMTQTRNTAERSGRQASLKELDEAVTGRQRELEIVIAEVDRTAARLAEAEQELKALRKQKREFVSTSDETRERARAILAERPDISGAALGRELGRSDSLGRKLRRELLPELAMGGNGSGKAGEEERQSA